MKLRNFKLKSTIDSAIRYLNPYRKNQKVWLRTGKGGADTWGNTISRSAANNDLVKAELYLNELENYHFEDDLLEVVWLAKRNSTPAPAANLTWLF